MSAVQEKCETEYSKGDSCSFNPTQTDGREAITYFALHEERASQECKAKDCVEKFFGGTCTEPSCDFWHPPVCFNHKSESGCKYGDLCNFLHTEAVGQPRERSQKGGAKGSVASLKETVRLGCVSHGRPQSKSILRRKWKIGIELHSQVFEGHDASGENSGEDGSSAGNHSKVRTSGRIPWGSKNPGKSARRSSETGAVLPQGRLGTGRGCSQTQKRVQKVRFTLLPNFW